MIRLVENKSGGQFLIFGKEKEFKLVGVVYGDGMITPRLSDNELIQTVYSNKTQPQLIGFWYGSKVERAELKDTFKEFISHSLEYVPDDEPVMCTLDRLKETEVFELFDNHKYFLGMRVKKRDFKKFMKVLRSLKGYKIAYNVDNIRYTIR